jgi:hypothetical protein
MLLVDVERGRRDGIAMAKELEEAEVLQNSHYFGGVEPGPIHMIDEEDDEIR